MTPCEHERANEILETRKFWCSKFIDMNDPMEGTFYARDDDVIDKIYNKKKAFSICSFSAYEALLKPTMWGYYAGGFKGIAIEVESCSVEKMSYVNRVPSHIDDDSLDAKSMLLSKFNQWREEDEFRFFTIGESGLYDVGLITAIYFGYPFADFRNCKKIYEDNEIFRCYIESRRRLLESAQRKAITCFKVCIRDGGIIEISDLDGDDNSVGWSAGA